MCTSMGQSRSKCFITPLFFHVFIEKSVCDYCVWYDEYLGRILSKIKNVDLGSYFGLSTQNQFYHKEPHLVMLGHIYLVSAYVM